MAVWSAVSVADTLAANRLDAEFYQPRFLAADKALRRCNAVSLQSLLSDVRYGLNVPPEYVDHGLPFLRALNLKEYGIAGEILNIPFAPEQVGEINILRTGDLLIVRSGANVGDTGVITSRFDGYTVGSYVIRMRLRNVDPFYAYVFLKCRFGRLQTVRFRSGSAQPNISIPNLEQVLVYVAPSQSQAAIRKQFVNFERALLSAQERLAEAESILTSTLGLDKLDLSPSLCYERPFARLIAAQRFDAEYFSPRYQRILQRLAKDDLTIGDVASLVKHRFHTTLHNPDDTFRYIEIGSLTSDGQAEVDHLKVSEAPSRAQWIVKSGDVMTSTVRPIRRLSAVATEEQDGAVCSSGFAVLRSIAGSIEPEVLLTYLRLPTICEILDLHTTASMYPAIPVDKLLKIPIALPAEPVRREIVAKVRESFAARRSARLLLEQAKTEVEHLVLDAGKE
jgi:hypothetical protein